MMSVRSKSVFITLASLLFMFFFALSPTYAALGDDPPTSTGTDMADEAANDMQDVADEVLENGSSETARYLHMLFGSLVDYGGEGSDDAQTLLGVYIKYMNYAVAGLGSVLLGYFVLVGMIQTSSDGEILGKKWSSTWVPVRISVAMVGLVPLPSGYLVAQVLLMKVALVTIGVTDWIQAKTIEEFIDGGVSISAAAPPNASVPVAGLTKMMLCQRTLVYSERQLWLIERGSSPAPAAIVIKETSTEKETVDGDPYSVTRIGADRIQNGKNKEPGVCGSIEFSQRIDRKEEVADFGFSALETVSQPIYDAHLEAIRKMLRVGGEIDVLVDQIAALSFPNKTRDYKPTREEINAVHLAYKKAIAVYETTVVSKSQEAISKLRSSSEKASKLKEALIKAGWLHAGSYYLTISSLNREIFEASSYTPIFQEPRAPRPADNGPAVNNIAYNSAMNVFDGLAAYVDGDPEFTPIYDFDRSYSDTLRDQRKTGDVLSDLMGDAIAWINSFFGEFASMFEFGKGFQERYSNGDAKYFADTLGELVHYGHFWLNIMLGIVGFYVVVSLAATFVNFTPQAALMKTLGKFIGKAAGGGGSPIGAFGIGIGMIVGFILSLSFAGAAFLALVLPAMPFLIWSTAVVGWFILITEAVIGASFWAVAHLMPNGEGLSGESGKKGWEILLNIAARPPLMLGGLYGGMGIFAMASTYYLLAWDWAVNDILLGHSAGLLTRILFAIMFVGLLAVIAERSFRFMTWLPDKVLRWMGVAVETIGDEAEDNRQRAVIMAGTHSSGTAVNRGSMAALGMGMKANNQLKDGGGEDAENGGASSKDVSATQTVGNHEQGGGRDTAMKAANASSEASDEGKRSSSGTEGASNNGVEIKQDGGGGERDRKA